MIMITPEIIRDSETPCCTHGCGDALECALLRAMCEPIATD